MKGLLIISLSLFSLAITFRLLHWPFAGEIAILSVLLILIFAITNSIKSKKVFNIGILGGWVLFFWSLYILFKYMYWYAGPLIMGFNFLFLLVFILTGVYLVTTLSSQGKRLSKTVLTVGIFGLTFSFVPSYATCYFFDLNELINKENNLINYYSWDKYSWFLYIRGEKNRALAANQKAIDAWHKRQTSPDQYGPENPDVLMILKTHSEGIINGTWTDSYIRIR